jgi:hypothetical protein
MACLLTYFRTEYGRDLEEILQEEPETAEELLKNSYGYYH